MTKVIAVAIQKGGTGKTTTVKYLAKLLAELGQRVLIIDTDPQSNYTKVIAKIEDDKVNISHVMLNGVSLGYARQGVGEGIDLIPSNFVDVSDADIRMNSMAATTINPRKHPIHILRQVIERDGGEWDYILIDCPPSTSLLAMGAIAAADTIVIPAQPDEMPYAMVKLTLELIEDVEAITGRTHAVLIVPTMVNAQSSNDQHWLAEMGARYFIPTRDGRNAERELMRAYQPIMEEIHYVA